MNKLDEQENMKNDQEKITIKYFKNCEKYSDQNEIEQEKTYENINWENPQRNYELNQIDQLQNGEKIQYNKQFVLNQQNLKLSSLLKDISGVFNQFEEDYQKYRNFSLIIEQFLQKENYLFHNYSTKYKKNKGQTQSVFTLYKILDIYTWNTYLIIDDRLKSISLKTILCNLSGDVFQIDEHNQRLLLSKYFFKLNSYLKVVNLSCHPTTGVICIKVNQYISQNSFEDIVNPNNNYEKLNIFLKQILCQVEQIIKESSYKILNNLNQITDTQYEYVINQFLSDKKQQIQKNNFKEASKRLKKVNQNLGICSYIRHFKDPKYQQHIIDQNQTSQEQEKIDNEYFKQINKLFNISNNLIYSELKIRPDGFKQEENSVAEGGFSEIYKVQMTIIQDNKQEVKKKFAVKKERYKSGRASHEKKILEMLEGKIQPNIAKFYWTKFPQCADDLIMEYYPNKSLDHFKVNFSVTLSLTSKLYILWQIVQGIKFLKDNSISHLDLKPANILIGKQLNAKISDFGESYHPKVCGRDFNPGRTVPYVPPEILQKQQNLQLYHDRIDVFSFGVIMSEVLFDEYPLVMKRGQQEKIQHRYKQKKYNKQDIKDYSFITEMNDQKKSQDNRGRQKNTKIDNTYYYRLLEQYKCNMGPKHCLKQILLIIFKCIEEPNERPFLEHLVVMIKDIQTYIEKITQ